MTTNSLTTCCESSGRTLTDSGAAAPAQTPVYCPVYESRLLATARHELNSAAALGVYGNPYTSTQGYGNYVTYGTEASAFYSLVSNPRIFLSLISKTNPSSKDQRKHIFSLLGLRVRVPRGNLCSPLSSELELFTKTKIHVLLCLDCYTKSVMFSGQRPV